MSEDNSATPDSMAISATDIVAAYVSNNSVPPTELPGLITSVYAALTQLAQGARSDAASEPTVEKPTPAQIRKSITPDALISFIDGKPYKTLKRHLTKNGVTIDEYRARYGLPRDYPSVCASYSTQRSELAKSLGLGGPRRKAVAMTASTSDSVAEAPTKRRSKKVA